MNRLYDNNYVFFPFALKNWEQRRVLRYWPVLHLDSRTVIVNEDGTVRSWPDSSNDPNNPIAKALMPKWFRLWLWLRTRWALV